MNDAHVYSGYTYDYYFKRFGRRGLDNNNIRIRSLVNPVRRTQADLALYFNQFPDFFINAFYAGGGIMVYGVGLPPGFTAGGQSWNHLSGALDVVAHELTHGVTEFTSNLIYRNESGALNEAFSDIMGTSVEFFFQPAGNGDLRADYLCARGRRASRAACARWKTRRRTAIPITTRGGSSAPPTTAACTSTPGIANHAFYLAIEGGTNRTSGLAVQGVGAANREQIETGLLPRVHADAADQRDVLAGARRHDPGGARSVRREQQRRNAP